MLFGAQGSLLTASVAWRACLGTVFFLSGAVSLVYEVVWARLLSYQLGNTTEAHTTVVAVFMGGLGLGYLVFGRYADRVARPMRTYAAVELGISLWALAFPWILDAVSATGAAGILVASVALLVPTMLMGATLPLLSRGLVERGLGVGASLSSLYAVNSAGAVLGTLAAGLVLVDWLGVAGALYAAVATNLLLSGAALLLARTPPSPAATAPSPSPAQIPSPTDATVSPVIPWLLAAVAGFVALGLQGVWLRYFGMVLGSSSYAFTLVIAAFIGGIALGSAGARRWADRWSTRDSMSVAFLLLAALVAALLAAEPLYDRFPYTLAHLKHDAAEQAGTGAAGFALYSAYRFALVCAVVLLPTAFSGALLPIVAAVATRRGQVATGAGRAFGANTLGSVLGVVVTVPVLIGAWGLGETYRALTLLTALTTAGLAFVLVRPRLEVRIGVGTLALVACLVVPAGWDARLLSAGSFRSKRPPKSFEAFDKSARRGDLVFHADGTAATVAVVERKGHRTLIVNGKPDASTRGDMLTQIGSAHLPLMLHPAPERMLVIGLGSGVTVGSAALHPITIDAVEISQAVVDASHAFDAVNGRPLERSNVTLHVDDARSFLQDRPEGTRYDVVVSEPSNPWVAGNAGLFGREFFETVRDHLSDDGVFAQWIHLYETDDESVELVVRTLGAVFPRLSLWEMFPNDVLLIARPSEGTTTVHRWGERVTPAIANDLARVHLDRPAALMSLRAIGGPALRAMADTPGPLTNDDRPRLEFRAPRGLFAGARAAILDDHDQRRTAPTELDREDAEKLFVLHTIYPGAPRSYRLSLIPVLLDKSEVGFITDVLFTLGREKRFEAARPVMARLARAGAVDPRAQYAIAWTHQAAGELEEARRFAKRCMALGDEPRKRCATLLHRLDLR